MQKKQYIKNDIHDTYMSSIYFIIMEQYKYLSGAQDLYLSPGSLKLFSFSITRCINQEIMFEFQFIFMHLCHVYLSNHLLNLCHKIHEIW